MSASDSTVSYRNVEGFPGYRVGDDGSVWTQWLKKGRGYRYGFANVLGGWRLLKPKRMRSGHLMVCLSPGTQWRHVSHLVLEAFVCPRPDGMECRHDPDPTPSNNNLGNLKWGTHLENMEDRSRHGRTCQGERHRSAKVKAAQVLEIRRRYGEIRGGRGKAPNGLMAALSAEFGLNAATILRIVHRKTWKSVP